MEQRIIFSIISLAVVFLLLNIFVILLIFTYQKKIRIKQEEIFKTIIETEETERSRIAKDLHDGIGSNLSAIKIHFSHLMEEMKDKQEVQFLKELINETANEVRQVSHQMMPPLLKQDGLYSSIENLCNRFKSESLTIEAILLGDQHIILADYAILMIYRTIQELIVNAIKHGKAKNIEVQIMHSKNQILLTISDDGLGYAIEKNPNGIGLKNIQSRITYLGGTINTHSKINEGTTSTIYLPLKASS